MPGSGDGDPRRRRSSGRSSGCSFEIDWIADEHGVLQRPSKHLKDEGEKRTAECLSHKKGDSLKRHMWSGEEDYNLIRMVNLHGSKRCWLTVAHSMPDRSPRQCRERWMLYLDPAVNNQPWSEQEEIELIKAHKVHGNKWRKVAKLFPGRTGKAIQSRRTSLMKKQMKSHFVREFPEQFPYMPNDQLVMKNKGSSTNTGQDSPKNVHVSPDSPVTTKSEQGPEENGRNESTLKGKECDSAYAKSYASHSINVSKKVAMQIGASNSLSSVDQKASSAIASFPGPLPKEESTNFLEVTPNRGLSPEYNHLSNNYPFNDICSSFDPESQELHLSNIADLLDMSYCESLLIVPPDSPNHRNSTDGM